MTPTLPQFITKINIKGSGIKPEPLNITLFRRIAIFGSATVCGVICGRRTMTRCALIRYMPPIGNIVVRLKVVPEIENFLSLQKNKPSYLK